LSLFKIRQTFYVTGEVNRQNVKYWTDSNPYWMSDSKRQGAGKLMVWCEIWGNSKTGHLRNTAMKCAYGWTSSFLGIGSVDVVRWSGHPVIMMIVMMVSVVVIEVSLIMIVVLLMVIVVLVMVIVVSVKVIMVTLTVIVVLVLMTIVVMVIMISVM
ncbi:hypothetical protein ANN_19799, partial [Periplaneta americana]